MLDNMSLSTSSNHRRHGANCRLKVRSEKVRFHGMDCIEIAEALRREEGDRFESMYRLINFNKCKRKFLGPVGSLRKSSFETEKREKRKDSTEPFLKDPVIPVQTVDGGTRTRREREMIFVPRCGGVLLYFFAQQFLQSS